MAANVKYQVFVSSTYEDLKQEREQVVKAVLEMGHIPGGLGSASQSATAVRVAPPKPVQLETHDDVDLPSAKRRHEAIQPLAG